MNLIHASLSYHNLPNEDVKTFADGILAGYIANNPPFTVQPYTVVTFTGLITTYETTRSAYENGGEAQKGPFLLAKSALMAAMDEMATETDKIALGNADTIILAGYTPTKERGETVKPGQCVVTVKRGIAGELISTCAIIENTKHYCCIVSEGTPLPPDIIIDGNGRIIVGPDSLSGDGSGTSTPTPVSVILDYTMQREKHFLDLKHDVTYYFYYFAVNSKGVGPMSEAVSMVCW